MTNVVAGCVALVLLVISFSAYAHEHAELSVSVTQDGRVPPSVVDSLLTALEHDLAESGYTLHVVNVDDTSSSPALHLAFSQSGNATIVNAVPNPANGWLVPPDSDAVILIGVGNTSEQTRAEGLLTGVVLYALGDCARAKPYLLAQRDAGVVATERQFVHEMTRNYEAARKAAVRQMLASCALADAMAWVEMQRT